MEAYLFFGASLGIISFILTVLNRLDVPEDTGEDILRFPWGTIKGTAFEDYIDCISSINVGKALRSIELSGPKVENSSKKRKVRK